MGCYANRFRSWNQRWFLFAPNRASVVNGFASREASPLQHCGLLGGRLRIDSTCDVDSQQSATQYHSFHCAVRLGNVPLLCGSGTSIFADSEYQVILRLAVAAASLLAIADTWLAEREFGRVRVVTPRTCRYSRDRTAVWPPGQVDTWTSSAL